VDQRLIVPIGVGTPRRLTIGEIRRAYFEQHRSIKEIVRTLSVSRATVRKVVRGHQTEFKYERGVQPSPKLGDWVEVLTEILEKEAKLPKRERRSTQRLFEELRGRGYDGAHDSVHRFVKAWRDERARVPVHAYVPMSFAPGEAYQFDWSHETITLQRDRPGISDCLHHGSKCPPMGVARRSGQHSFDQALRARTACHCHFPASKYRYAADVGSASKPRRPAWMALC
jgi:hypothetical protein